MEGGVHMWRCKGPLFRGMCGGIGGGKGEGERGEGERVGVVMAGKHEMKVEEIYD